MIHLEAWNKVPFQQMGKFFPSNMCRKRGEREGGEGRQKNKEKKWRFSEGQIYMMYICNMG